jgi:hypothetical protein
VAVQEGTVKVPAGATALPPDTVPLPGVGKNFFYNAKGDLFGPDGTLLQRGTDAKPETPPAQATPDRAPARDTNPSALPPVRQPALVGARAADGARLGGDAGRLGPGLGDDAPGPVPDRTPGGGAGDNMPTNNLDNGVGGRSGDTTPTPGGRDLPPGGGTRDVPGGSTADNGVPRGAAAHNGTGSVPDAPGAGGADDAAHRAEYEAAREKPAGERTPAERAAVTREHVRLANEDPVWRAEHYDKWGPGKRNGAEMMVDGQLLPKLTERPGGGWMAADDLPYANPENYHLEGLVRGRDTVDPQGIDHLDDVSAKRLAGMDLIAAERAFEANPSDETAKTLIDAQEHFKQTVGEGVSNNTKLGEALGEEAARHHMLLQKEFEGAKEVTDLPETPNGSRRFDQLWRDKDGNLIIVEAKGPNARLDWRQGNGALDRGTLVKQGTLEYVRTICSDMEQRAFLSPKDAQYAKEIRAAIENKTLRYVLVQASENTGKYAGAELKHFKIF